MNFFRLFDRIGNIGVKGSYNSWEIYLTRKLNFLSIVGVFNMICSLGFFYSVGLNEFIPECILTILVGPFVIVLNQKKNYVWAGYLFFLIGIVLFSIVTLKMGLDTMVVLYYFPILISLVQIFGRKETIRQLFIIASLFLLSIIILVIGYNNNVMRIKFDDETLQSLKMFNVLSSFFLTTILVLLLTRESIKQEALIKNMLHEKEILLAEVFHRVKNNMNIVTSLLNLKKNVSNSEEVKNAIEECRSRVYSMALVHQKIYNNNSIHSLNFKEYVYDLVSESVNSIDGEGKIEVSFKTEPVDLPINYAIPCGLILNELITNSFKHAQTNDRKLKIEIGLSNKNGLISMSVKDNGPGIDHENKRNQNSLGMDLIRSLTDQIDGKLYVSNDNGTLSKVEFVKS